MGERDISSTVVLTDEDKEKATEEALKIKRSVAGPDHGVISQDDLLALSDEELKHRFVEIADRGFVSLRLSVPLPPEWYGEWFGTDPQSIAEAQAKGFIIDDKFAPKFALHHDGTGKPIVGDVIHMICHRRIKDAHDAAAKHRYERVHGKPRDLPEESQFENSIESLGLPVKFKDSRINTSLSMSANQTELLNAVKGT